MSIGILFTIIALILAVYAILPRERRLELLLKFRWSDYIATGLVLGLLHYLQFYTTFGVLGLTPEWNLGRWGITPTNASYLVATGFAIALAISIWLAKMPRRKIGRLRELVDELVNRGRFAELFYLLERHLPTILRIQNSDFVLPRLRLRLLSLGHRKNSSWRPHGEQQEPQGVVGRLSSLFPSGEREAKVAHELLRVLLRGRRFAEAVVRIRPYFGIQLLGIQIYERNDFLNEYLREMVRQPWSVLYSEITQNQNIMAWHRYGIADGNRLLAFLIGDMERAREWAVYKPIGDQVLAELDRLRVSPSSDPLLRSSVEFNERGRWQSPVFIGIRFFDIMVSEAVFENTRWHMWIYYFPHFASAIIQNLEAGRDHIRRDNNQRLDYEELLSDLIQALLDQLSCLSGVPRNQENVALQQSPLELENGNPIKSSIFALGSCLRSIVLCDVIPDRFRYEHVSQAFNEYFELKGEVKAEDYAEVLLLVLMYGGSYERRNDERYLGYILRTFVRRDNIPHKREHFQEVVNRLSCKFVKKYGRESLERYVDVEDNGRQSR